eukprot:SAG11_NODE_15598_length_572_cov_1.298097_1_plen_144_part_00
MHSQNSPRRKTRLTHGSNSHLQMSGTEMAKVTICARPRQSIAISRLGSRSTCRRGGTTPSSAMRSKGAIQTTARPLHSHQSRSICGLAPMLQSSRLSERTQCPAVGIRPRSGTTRFEEGGCYETNKQNLIRTVKSMKVERFLS